jgi:hypothetical protein
LNVNLEKKNLEITAGRKIKLQEVTAALLSSPKYTVSEVTGDSSIAVAEVLKNESLLKTYRQSFSGYDPLAQKWLFYAYIYPFIELFLGFLFIAGKALPLAFPTPKSVCDCLNLSDLKRL